jgi:hypothetical protein
MFVFAILYFLTCLFWMLYALRWQLEIYPHSSLARLIICCVLNFMFCPMAIVMAHCNFDRI